MLYTVVDWLAHVALFPNVKYCALFSFILFLFFSDVFASLCGVRAKNEKEHNLHILL